MPDPRLLPGNFSASTTPANPVDRIYKTDGKKNYCKHYDPQDDPWASEEVSYGSEIDYNYQDYAADPGPYLPNGVKNRRLLIFPTVNCDGSQNGQSTLVVTGFACFFMAQPLDTGNIGQGGGQIMGQYVNTCEANGSGGANPGGTNPLLYKIQLYKDFGSGDS